MAPRRSAGLLVFRRADHRVEVLLGHMGGPYWVDRPRGWSIPKGEHGPDEEPLAAALREFAEETGLAAPEGPRHALGEARMPSGKVVAAWAVQGDLDAAAAVSNTFTMQWPPRSGRMQEFPELDRFAWVDLAGARELLVSGQVVFLDRLAALLG
jgi:predicted NUDIX family NTP pyrophosphohydrolase